MKMNMKKIFPFRGWTKLRKSESRKPLIEQNNNEDIQAGYNHAVDRYDNPLAQNNINIEQEQRSQREKNITFQEIAELLGVSSETTSDPPEVGSCCSEQQTVNQCTVHLMQSSASQKLPKPPAGPNQSLQQHLANVHDTVINELLRLGPLLESKELMGCLIECYHRQTFHHLQLLLQDIRSSRDSFMLMNWVLHTYLSEELLGHPDHLLFREWEANAKNKVLENVQKEIKGSLDKILQIEGRQDCCDSEETYIGLYVDIIQCINAMPNEAQKISPELYDGVREVCFEELQMFVGKYMAEQDGLLGKKAKLNKPETIYFLKTLKTCKELRKNIQTKGEGVRTSLLEETVATLGKIETFTLKLLMKIVADITEHHLKKYFKSDDRQLSLLAALEEYFPKLDYVLDEQKVVMDEAYKIIAHTYLEHLLKSSQHKLRRFWSPDVGQRVDEDAHQLHSTMSDLAPGVQQWNQILLMIPDVLECKSIDLLKLIVAEKQQEFVGQSMDLKRLLRWNGLSEREVREVLEALPGSEPTYGSGSWFSCLICC
ncbi:exocyst complex component 3 [Embiotoca jacksoni]|uniref:exocyst complex component 3 n=1 Tax=Embiotoca jacksoni TaxID=100190 RepID=UPI003704BBEE